MSEGSDEEQIGAYAATWFQIGITLMSIGATVASTFALGATQELWRDTVFLAGFVGACLVTAIGVYLTISGIMPLPLPPTGRGRRSRRTRRSPDTNPQVVDTWGPLGAAPDRDQDSDRGHEQVRVERLGVRLALGAACMLTVAAAWLVAAAIRLH